MGDAGDDYVTVPVTIMAIRPDSVRVSRGALAAWIARSLIHGVDDNLLRAAKAGDLLKLRIRRWKVDETHLNFPEARQRSLFG